MLYVCSTITVTTHRFNNSHSLKKKIVKLVQENAIMTGYETKIHNTSKYEHHKEI